MPIENCTVICGGLQATLACSILSVEHGSIIGGPPLETCQSLWRYGPKKLHEQYRGDTCVVSTCATVAATDTAADDIRNMHH